MSPLTYVIDRPMPHVLKGSNQKQLSSRITPCQLTFLLTRVSFGVSIKCVLLMVEKETCWLESGSDCPNSPTSSREPDKYITYLNLMYEIGPKLRHKITYISCRVKLYYISGKCLCINISFESLQVVLLYFVQRWKNLG